MRRKAQRRVFDACCHQRCVQGPEFARRNHRSREGCPRYFPRTQSSATWKHFLFSKVSVSANSSLHSGESPTSERGKREHASLRSERGKSPICILAATLHETQSILTEYGSSNTDAVGLRAILMACLGQKSQNRNYLAFARLARYAIITL